MAASSASTRVSPSSREISRDRCRHTPSSSTIEIRKSRFTGVTTPTTRASQSSSRGKSIRITITTPVSSHSAAYFSRSFRLRTSRITEKTMTSPMIRKKTVETVIPYLPVPR